MNTKNLTILLKNAFVMLLGGGMIFIGIYMGLKNYYELLYIVYGGAILIAAGVFLILLSIFLCFYKDYWDVMKKIIVDQLLLKYKLLWISIVFFIGALFLSSLLSLELYNLVRSAPVFPIHVFKFFNISEATWVFIYSVILRYTIGIAATVVIWYYLLKKYMNRTHSNTIEPTNAVNSNSSTLQNNEEVAFSNPQNNAGEVPHESTFRNSPNKSTKVKNFLVKHKFAVLFFSAFLLRFIIYLNAYPGYDTGFYLTLVRDAVENNNLDIFFNDLLFVNQANHALMALPTCLPLIGLSYLTGGDVLLAAAIYIPLLSILIIYLVCKIVEKATNSQIMSFLVGTFLSFSVVQFILIAGLYKQLTTTCVTLAIIYLLFFTEHTSWVKNGLSYCCIFLLMFIDMFYFLTIGTFFIILLSYILLKKQIDWAFLKNPKVFLLAKIVFIIGFIGFGGILTFLYYHDAIPILDLSFFFELITKFSVATSPSFWTLGYNTINLLLPLLFTLPFALYGFFMDYKHNYFKYNHFQLFLRVAFIALIILTFSEMLYLGFFEYITRFILYLDFVLIVYAAIGIFHLYTLIKSKYSMKPFFRKSKQLFIGIFLCCLVLGSILSIPFFRYGKLAPSEKEGIEWLLYNGDTEKLTNELRNDVVVVANHHLEYWIQYFIHYNALNTQMYWTIGAVLRYAPVNQFISTATETIYFLVSRIREPSGETWTDTDVLNYILEINTTLNKNYYLIYNTSVVYIYEIEI